MSTQSKTQDNAFAMEVCQLTVNYEKTPVLWDLSFSVPKGKLVGILGPNGAGKTTLLKAALGLIKPHQGKISFFSKPVEDCRGTIAYIPQKEAVDWDFPITVVDLVMMGRYGKLGWFKWPKKADKEAAMLNLERVGMQAFAQRQISQLSGGQQQRVFIARALMQEAEIYFCDEPFSGIDMSSEQLIVEIFQKMRDEGKTVFIVHHDLNTVESYFDWLVILNMHLVACGSTVEIFNEENLFRAYGKSHALFGEATKLAQGKTFGIDY